MRFLLQPYLLELRTPSDSDILAEISIYDRIPLQTAYFRKAFRIFFRHQEGRVLWLYMSSQRT